MSLTAVENKINLNTWFSDNLNIDMIGKMDKGLDSLDAKEKDVLKSFVDGHILLLITEWRLGRMDQNPIYYRNQIHRLLENTAMRELVSEMRTNMRETVTQGGVIALIDEVYKETTR